VQPETLKPAIVVHCQASHLPVRAVNSIEGLDIRHDLVLVDSIKVLVDSIKVLVDSIKCMD